MKKQLVLFVGSSGEYESFKSLNNSVSTRYLGSGDRSELLLGYNNNIILITQFGREIMTHEFEFTLVRVKESNTIIYL